jgi:hypothetical protein
MGEKFLPWLGTNVSGRYRDGPDALGATCFCGVHLILEENDRIVVCKGDTPAAALLSHIYNLLR